MYHDDKSQIGLIRCRRTHTRPYKYSKRIIDKFNVLLTLHLDNLFNENQLDTLFILSLFRQKTSTCFGLIYRPSSGGIHCIRSAIGTC
jgi:hypothetical protein